VKKHINKVGYLIFFLSLFVLLFGCKDNQKIPDSNINQIKNSREELKIGLKKITSYNRSFIEVEDLEEKTKKAELTESEYMFLKNNTSVENFLYKGKLYSLKDRNKYTGNLNKNTTLLKENSKNYLLKIEIAYKNTNVLRKSIVLINPDKIPNIKELTKNNEYDIFYNIYEYKGELR